MVNDFLVKLIKYIVVPLILVFISILLSIIFFFNSDINPNILSHNESANNIAIKNSIISGKFKAVDNYLGIISVRFDEKNIIDEDSVFRIKNVLDSEWYYVATISAAQYNITPFYAFGFPVVSKSNNNTYKFEVELISDNRGLSVSTQEPVFDSQYKYPTELLFKNFDLLTNLVKYKISHYIRGQESWKVMAVYAVPLFAYLLYLIFEHKLRTISYIAKLKKKLRFILNPSISFILFFIGIDTFVIKNNTKGIVNTLVVLWTMGLVAYRLESRFSFGVALIFLLFCPFLLGANMEWVAEKSAVLAYMFLIVGTLHSIINTSSVLKKIASIKLIVIFIKYLRFIFLRLDMLFIYLLRTTKQVIFRTMKLYFKRQPKNLSDLVLFIGKIFFLVVSLGFVLITSVFIALHIYTSLNIIHQKKIRLSLNPNIRTVEPRFVYKATKVVIYGTGFGWKGNESVLLSKGGKPIVTDLWTDTKIIFTIPLHWKRGNNSLQIKKQISWNGKMEIAKSEVFEIKILPSTGGFTTDDALYFKQLETLQNETLEINGL